MARVFTIRLVRSEKRVELNADEGTRAWVRDEANADRLLAITRHLHGLFVGFLLEPQHVLALADMFASLLREVFPEEAVEVRLLPARF